jgi:hypothetical protein
MERPRPPEKQYGAPRWSHKAGVRGLLGKFLPQPNTPLLRIFELKWRSIRLPQ